MPDFYFLLKPTDRGWFVLADDFGKVDAKGKMTEVNHHFIDGFNIDPDPAKELSAIDLTKEESKTVLNLFGVAGTAVPGQIGGRSRRGLRSKRTPQTRLIPADRGWFREPAW